MFLMLTILLLDNTVYLLNLYVQSMGFYVQNLLQVSSHKFSLLIVFVQARSCHHLVI